MEGALCVARGGVETGAVDRSTETLLYTPRHRSVVRTIHDSRESLRRASDITVAEFGIIVTVIFD